MPAPYNRFRTIRVRNVPAAAGGYGRTMVTHEIDHRDTDDTPMAYAPLPPGLGVREEWVMTRRQQVTVLCALVLAFATGVVAVALGLSLAS
jgi:hypothetical protein